MTFRANGGRRYVMNPTEIAAIYAARDEAASPTEPSAETLEQIADRIAPNGGKAAAMKAAKAKAKAAAENAAYAARREALHTFNDATDYWRAMVVSCGAESDEARRAYAERELVALCHGCFTPVNLNIDGSGRYVCPKCLYTAA